MSTGGFPGTYKLLMSMAGARVGRWTFLLEDAPGIEVLGFEAGSDAHLFLARDFDAAAGASASAGVGGRAVVLGDKQVQIDDTMIARFGPVNQLFGPQVNRLSVTTPGGDKDCDLYTGAGGIQPICYFDDFVGNVAGPGAYTFHSSGAGAGGFSSEDVMLSVLDARLPD